MQAVSFLLNLLSCSKRETVNWCRKCRFVLKIDCEGQEGK